MTENAEAKMLGDLVLDSFRETAIMIGHTYRVTSVAFSPDGKRLASASVDRTVKVWDARPWTPELRVEQQALSLIRFLQAKPLAKSAMIETIEMDETISEPVRLRALEFAREWRESPAQ